MKIENNRHSRENGNPAETCVCHRIDPSEAGSPVKPRMTRHMYGFTLVELIVVITILVILGTIAFLNLGGFQSSARDGRRVSDMANIGKAIDLAIIQQGSAPIP
ncbi:MAG: type II secretion system protein, partial [Candidatus Gracilibacteria bacterium]|nr:type II secretion system protein [Candidatus Gracilibacteria bacterium]